MLHKFLPLFGALLVAGPASAISVNMSDFSFGSPTSVKMQGTDGSPSYEGAAGRFDGGFVSGESASAALRLTAAPAAPDSFVAWCAELTQTFNFGVTYQYEQTSGVSYFGATKATDLSRLFTAAQGFVVDRFTSAAMQAGIWEIIYEHGPSFSLTGGTFMGAPEEAAGDLAHQPEAVLAVDEQEVAVRFLLLGWWWLLSCRHGASEAVVFRSGLVILSRGATAGKRRRWGRASGPGRLS